MTIGHPEAQVVAQFPDFPAHEVAKPGSLSADMTVNGARVVGFG